MQTMTDLEATDNFSALLERVSKEPVTIIRNGTAAAVMVGADEYASISETLHLLSTPANSERLRRSLKDYDAGKLVSGELCG